MFKGYRAIQICPDMPKNCNLLVQENHALILNLFSWYFTSCGNIWYQKLLHLCKKKKKRCTDFKTLFFRLLCDTVINFQSNQEEVSLIVSPEKITFKNYVDDEPGNRFFLRCIIFPRAKIFEQRNEKICCRKSWLCKKNHLYANVECSVLRA